MAKKIIIEAQEPQKNTPPVKEAAAVAVFVIDDKPITMDILKTRVAEYQKLTIKGIEDKKGLEAVKLAKADLRTTRNRLDDVRKDANKPFQDKIDSNNKLAKDLNAIMNPVEDELDTKLADHEKLVTAEKERKAEETKKRNQARKENIIKLGYELDERLNILSLPDKSSVVNMSLVEQMNDKEYGKLLKTIVDASVVYQAYVVEQKALDLQEESRRKTLEAIDSKYSFTFGTAEDVRNMTIAEFDTLVSRVELEYETEQQRRDEETKFIQLRADREVQIKDLYHTYQLPFGFFPDTADIAGIKEPDVYAAEFEKMNVAAIADKKRRDDDKAELDTLRSKVTAPSFSITPSPTFYDIPVEPDVIDNEEPAGGIELIEEEPKKLISTHVFSNGIDKDTTLESIPADQYRLAKNIGIPSTDAVPETVQVDKSDIEFITTRGTNLVTDGKYYTFLPYWIEIVDATNNLVKFHPLGNLPQELIDEVNELKETW